MKEYIIISKSLIESPQEIPIIELLAKKRFFGTLETTFKGSSGLTPASAGGIALPVWRVVESTIFRIVNYQPGALFGSGPLVFFPHRYFI